MGARFDADGDTWELAVEPHPAERVDAVVFHCISNPQRPYRVLPISSDVLELEGGLESLAGADRLREMFERSQVMDYTRDVEANPKNVTPRTEP
ncbi:MAG: hypothetical protein ACREMQ_18960 [Longimicrobiales bacterium]